MDATGSAGPAQPAPASAAATVLLGIPGLRAELLECRLAVSGVGLDGKIGHLCFFRYCLQFATERVVSN